MPSGAMSGSRACPADYGYSPRVLARPAELEAEALHVAGGLYGNPQALDAVLALRALERIPVTTLFNGDFHWLDADGDVFAAVEAGVSHHPRLRGNVETELARQPSPVGCGCGYPDSVADEVVAASEQVMARLRGVADAQGGAGARLRDLPVHVVAQVAGERVAVLHGDPCSLAGWGLGLDALDAPGAAANIARWVGAAGVRVFASSHTGLAVARTFDLPGGEVLVANNGAAGLPAFRGALFGTLTRISSRPAPPELEVLYGVQLGGLHVDAVPVRYDRAGFAELFRSLWPPGSAARRLYEPRILNGPAHTPARAVGGRVRLWEPPRPFVPTR